MTMISAAARPDVHAFLSYLNALPGPRTHELAPAEARMVMKLTKEAADVPRGPIARVADLDCPGPAGAIPLRLYDAREEAAPAPVILFFHGGGFVVGDLDTHDPFCAEMARAMQLPVVAVDYRLAPEAPFPAAPDDCEAAARWVAANGAALGIAPTALITCGDSAGGNLAIVTAQALRAAPAACPVIAQFPIYPVVTASNDYPSYREFGQGHLLTVESMRYFGEHYAAPDDDPRNACLFAPHEDTPPTVVMTAGLDPLRDQGRDYAARLIAHGVTTCHYEAAGNIHGFISLRRAIPSSDRDLAAAFALLRAVIADQLRAGHG